MITEAHSVEIRSRSSWLRLVSGLVVVLVLFHSSALALGSDRGQAGIAVGAIVVAALLVIERFWFAATLADAVRAIGLSAPARVALLASTLI